MGRSSPSPSLGRGRRQKRPPRVRAGPLPLQRTKFRSLRRHAAAPASARRFCCAAEVGRGRCSAHVASAPASTAGRDGRDHNAPALSAGAAGGQFPAVPVAVAAAVAALSGTSGRTRKQRRGHRAIDGAAAPCASLAVGQLAARQGKHQMTDQPQAEGHKHDRCGQGAPARETPLREFRQQGPRVLRTARLP